MPESALDPREGPGNSGPETSLSVLLIEDSPEVTRRFEDCLQEGLSAASFRHAESLEAGLQALRDTRPDVLVIDLDLSESGSPEGVKALVSAAPGIPLVALTESGELRTALAAQRAGATEHLQKGTLTPALVGRTLRWATQRRRMHAKLRQRDAWIRSITEGLSAGIFRTGPTGRVEYANEALAEMLGFEEEGDLIGRDLTTFYADPLQRGRMLVQEGAKKMEVEFEGRDGSRFIGLLTAEATYDSSGVPVHYNGVINDITERVRRQKRLRMLSEAVGQAKEAVLITEAEPLEEPGPQIVYANQAFEEMTGYSEDEVLGETPRFLQGPETDREVLDSLRDALESGETWEGETVNYRKDGTPYRVQWNVAPVSGEDGSIEHWVSVQRDVTEEREREQELRRQKALLEQAQRLAGAWEVDLRSEEVSWTEKVYDIHEVEPGTEIGVDEAVEFYPSEARSRVQEAFERCIEAGEPYDLEVPLITAEGTARWVRTVGAPVEEGGETVKVAGAFQDITERKEAEERLRRERDLLSRVLETSPAAIVRLDREGRFVQASGRAEKILGLEKEAVTDRTYNDPEWGIEAPDGSPIPDEELPFAQVMATGEPVYDFEHAIVWPDGTRRLLSVSGAPLRAETGELEGAVFHLNDITEQREAETELRETTRFYEQVFEQVPIDLAVFRPNAEFEYLNPQSVSDPDRREAILGRTNEEYFRERGFDPEVGRRRDRAIREAAREEIQTEFEETLQTEEGPRHYLRVHGPVTNAEGEVTHVVGFGLEITDRKRSRRRLEEYHEYTSRMLDAIDDLFFVLDEEGTFQRWNRRVVEVSGYSGEEIDKMSAFDLVPEEEHEKVDQEIDRALSTGSGQVEVPLRLKDGETIPYEFMGDLVEHPDGSPRIVGVGRNISERVERERTLERQKDLFEKAQEIADVGAWEYDVHAEESVLTDQAYRIHGLAPESKMTPERSLEFYHPEDRPAIRQAFRRAVEEGEPYELELRLQTEDGEQRWVHTRGEPQREGHNGDGEVVRVRGTLQDITERKQREKELVRAKEQAEEANRLKTAMLANMSHEIRTPLTSITGFGQVLEEELDGALKDYARRIRKGGERLETTLGSILQLSELESGTYELDRQPLSLDSVVEETVEMLRPSAVEQKITLETDLPEASVTGEWNEGALNRILENLLENAIKFTEEGGTVRVQAREEGPNAVLVVEDTGIGIEEEVQDSIFEPFRQESEGRSRDYEGTGLGLSIVRRLVEAHGGTIEVESEKGQGSRFTIRLPTTGTEAGPQDA